MQLVSIYWQRITAALLHVHEKQLKLVRGQQAELHLLWHHQQLLLLLFHNIQAIFCFPSAWRKKKKTLSFYASIMPTFSLWKEQLSSHLRCFCDRKYLLAQGFTVWSLNFSYLKFCNVKNVSKTQPQFNFPLPLRSWKFTSNRTFSPTCSNQSSRRTFLRDFS